MGWSAPIGRRGLLAGAAGTAALGVLAACSGGSHRPRAASTSAGPPRTGGTLRWGSEAEVDGTDPAENHWDVNGFTYAQAVYDPLALIAADGSAQPYLAQAIAHSPDYTQWTITARSGVAFHDGETCDAAAIATNLERSINSPLTGPALANVRAVSVRGETVVVAMKQPWVVFDRYLVAGSQLGYIASPKAIKGGNLATHPVGTGPFVFDSWTPNSKFRVTRNPHYWYAGHPRVEAIEIAPIVDSTARTNSLKAGTVDGIYLSEPRDILNFQHNADFSYADDQANTVGEPALVFVMINTGVPPVDDLRIRQALAHATDQVQLDKIAAFGLGRQYLPITGPFPNGSPYHADTGYPRFDLAKAKALVAAYARDKGGVPTVRLGTTNDPTNVQNSQLLQAMWQRSGLKVQIDEIEQATYITNALTGNYMAYGWIQFGATDPDGNYVWWSPTTAAPEGSLALNFARNRDPQIEAALQQGRTHPDPATRQQAYRTVAQRLAADLPYIWLGRSIGAVATSHRVRDVSTFTAPSGASVSAYRGLISPGGVWLSP